MKLRTAIMTTVFLGATPALSQQTTDQYIDDLLTCSIIYGSVSEKYLENDHADEAASFTATANAYGVIAHEHVIRRNGFYEVLDLTEQRMKAISDSLNHDVESRGVDELTVIDEWLGYCDSLGPSVHEQINQPRL